MCRDVPDSTWRLAGTDCVPQSRCPERGRAPGWVLKLTRGREQPRRPAHEPHHECPRRLRFFLAKRLWIVRAQDGAFGLIPGKETDAPFSTHPGAVFRSGKGLGSDPATSWTGAEEPGGGCSGSLLKPRRQPGPPPHPPCCDERLRQRASRSRSRSLGVQRPERTRLLVHAGPAFCRLRTWRKATGSSLGPLS